MKFKNSWRLAGSSGDLEKKFTGAKLISKRQTTSWQRKSGKARGGAAVKERARVQDKAGQGIFTDRRDLKEMIDKPEEEVRAIEG